MFRVLALAVVAPLALAGAARAAPAPGALGGAALGGAALALTTDDEVDREPPLVCPFEAGACRAGRAAAGRAQDDAAQLRLTRTCLRGGRLRMRVRGDVSEVRRVTFAFGRLVVARDGRAPFARVVGRAALRRTRQKVLLANVYPRRGSHRVTLRRTLPRCGV